MNRFLSLAFVSGTIALLASCGSDEDTAPPELDKVDPVLVSVFDSVALTFDEGVAPVGSDQVESSPKVRIYATGGKSVYLAGIDSVVGYPLFLGDTTYKVTLTGVSDGDGNVADPIKTEFNTMPLLDHDFEAGAAANESRGTSVRLADSAKFFDGTPLSSELVACGILTSDAGRDQDFLDVYKLRLRSRDSVSFELSGFRGNVILKFEGPTNPAGELISADAPAVLSSASGDKQVLQLKIDANRHAVGTSNLDKFLDYWITVKYPTATDGLAPTPYVLTAKIKQR